MVKDSYTSSSSTFASDTVAQSNRLNFIGTMATETSSTLLSPEAFLKVYIPPRCSSVDSPIVSLWPKSDRPDSQQLCLWRWPAHHTQSYDDLDMLFRRYWYHTVPDDLPTIRMWAIFYTSTSSDSCSLTWRESNFGFKYIEPTIQLINNEFLRDEAPALWRETDSNNSGKPDTVSSWPLFDHAYYTL